MDAKPPLCLSATVFADFACSKCISPYACLSFLVLARADQRRSISNGGSPGRPMLSHAGVLDSHASGNCDGVCARGRPLQLYPRTQAARAPGRAAGSLDLPAADHWPGLLPQTGECFGRQA